MKCAWLLLPICGTLLLVLGMGVEAGPYLEDDEGYPLPDDDYSENAIDKLWQPGQKRACVPRGGNCDYRKTDCCYNSSCRCNLWGVNCRCQRMGLFQKWG